MSKSRGSTELQTIVQSCYDLAKSQGISTRDAARQMVRKTQDEKMLRMMATEYLVLFLAKDERAQELQAERAAEREKLMTELVGTSRGKRAPRRGSKLYREWVEKTDEGKAYEDEQSALEAASLHRLNVTLAGALDEYAESLKMEWTAEILATTFRLGDGTAVTWGSATIEQHEQRRQLFLSNAHSNLEGAARHEHAIRDLQTAGVASLSEMKVAA